MRCQVCTRMFRDNEAVVPIVRYITSRRGDFTSAPVAYVHVRCLVKRETT